MLRHLTIVGLAALLFASPVIAGNNSNRANGVPALPADEIALFSKRVESELAGRGARVAIVARSGRPKTQLPEQIEYTHVGLAVYSMIERQDGRRQPGYAMYNLYQRADRRDRSSLVQDYAFDFFAAVPELRAGIIIPKPVVQRRLLSLINDESYLELHNPSYSVISNPDNNMKQNCTEFVLNVLNSSIYQTTDMDHIKRVTQDHFYAQPIKVSRFTLTFGAAFSREITLQDQVGNAKTATFTTIAQYMEKFDLLTELIHLQESN